MGLGHRHERAPKVGERRCRNLCARGDAACDARRVGRPSRCSICAPRPQSRRPELGAEALARLTRH